MHDFRVCLIRIILKRTHTVAVFIHIYDIYSEVMPFIPKLCHFFKFICCLSTDFTRFGGCSLSVGFWYSWFIYTILHSTVALTVIYEIIQLKKTYFFYKQIFFIFNDILTNMEVWTNKTFSVVELSFIMFLHCLPQKYISYTWLNICKVSGVCL